MDKKSLSESDICAKYITPAVLKSGWDEAMQIRREVYFIKGRIIVRGKLVTRGQAKRADYVLYYQHLAIALVEAKDNTHTMGDGMQQALDYATTLDIPFVFSSNGDGFLFHDRTVTQGAIETPLTLDEFPSPRDLWAKYREWKGLALVNENADLVQQNSRYVMQITGDDDVGKAQLDNFIDPESKYPVIVTTSQLLSTGVDAQTCSLIVLEREVGSMTEFKQIVGRGTRVHEDTQKKSRLL